MSFAGHFTLGSAHVVRALRHAGDALTLETHVGVTPVSVRCDVWVLKANAPQTRADERSATDLAQTLCINAADIAHMPLWVSAGNEQLMVPPTSMDAVRRCRPDAARVAAETGVADATKIFAWADAGDG